MAVDEARDRTTTCRSTRRRVQGAVSTWGAARTTGLFGAVLTRSWPKRSGAVYGGMANVEQVKEICRAWDDAERREPPLSQVGDFRIIRDVIGLSGGVVCVCVEHVPTATPHITLSTDSALRVGSSAWLGRYAPDEQAIACGATLLWCRSRSTTATPPRRQRASERRIERVPGPMRPRPAGQPDPTVVSQTLHHSHVHVTRHAGVAWAVRHRTPPLAVRPSVQRHPLWGESDRGSGRMWASPRTSRHWTSDRPSRVRPVRGGQGWRGYSRSWARGPSVPRYFGRIRRRIARTGGQSGRRVVG